MSHRVTHRIYRVSRIRLLLADRSLLLQNQLNKYTGNYWHSIHCNVNASNEIPRALSPLVHTVVFTRTSFMCLYIVFHVFMYLMLIVRHVVDGGALIESAYVAHIDIISHHLII